jgi:hypothetical protein
VTGQQVTITFKTAVISGAVKPAPYSRGSFITHIVDDPWETGEILLPSALGKDKIWEHLQSLRAIPSVSQFVVYSGRQDASKLDKWPEGEIVAVPHTFSVTWEIENPKSSTSFDVVIQEEMPPMVTANEAWDRLHTVEPRLFEEAMLDYQGKLRPGLTIRAEIIQKTGEVGVEFEVIRKGKIRFIHEGIPNMATWAEIHAHFAEDDERIPPLNCYIDEENRPHIETTLLKFRLADGVDIPDTTGAFGGAAGGVSPKGCILRPIIFPKPPIYTTGEPRWQEH